MSADLIFHQERILGDVISWATPTPLWSLLRHQPIMPKNLPIMLLSIAQKLSLLCSKLCFQNQDYALELTVLLEYISLS